MREFDAIAVGEFEVLCQTADPAIWHQTCRFGVEEMLAATAGMSSLLQLERPPKHVSGEVRGALESGAGTTYTPLQGERGVRGERQGLTPQESAQMAPAAARGVEAEEQLRNFDCGFEPRGQVDAQLQRESQCAVVQLQRGYLAQYFVVARDKIGKKMIERVYTYGGIDCYQKSNGIDAGVQGRDKDKDGQSKVIGGRRENYGRAR